jgi:hypothetical protein
MSIELTWTKQDNSPDGNWEIYRSTDGTLGSEITGGLSVGTTSYTDAAIDDGQEYFYTLRRNTDHASTDSTQVSIVAIIPTPNDFAVTVDLSTAEVTATWTDTVDGEINWIVQVSRDGGSTWEDVSGELAPNTTTYSENYIAANATDWRVFITGDDTTGVSNTDSLSNTIDVAAEGLDIKLVDSDHNIRSLETRDNSPPESTTVTRQHTGLSDWRANARFSNAEDIINNWKSRLTEVYLYWDQSLRFRGFMPIAETGTDALQTLVEGPDVLDILRRDETVISYSAISYADAIEDYIDTHTPFDGAVQAPNPTEIVTNEDVFQADSDSEFAAETDIQDTDPVEISGGAVNFLQTAFTVEGENYDRETGTLSNSNTDRYSNGDAVVFDDSASAEWDFTTSYAIPEGAFALPFRVEIPSDGLDPQELIFELDINGNGFEGLGKFNFAPIDDPEWFDLSGLLAQDDGATFSDPGELPAGSHTLRITTGATASTTETFTSEWNTFVSLEFDDIVSGTETVTTTDGNVTFSGGGDDYTMNYSAGEIRVEATGSMDDDTEYQISYDYQSNVGTDTVAIDVLAPVADGRQTYTVDNTLDAPQGSLDGPEHYPTAGYDLPFNLQDLPYNVQDVIIDTTWDDTSEGQAIAASNDGGTTFTSASNTADATLTPSSVGTQLVFRATLSGYGSQSATPATGINGQIVSFVDVDYTGTDLAVIDDLTLRESDFRNLKRLFDNSNYRWAIPYAEESLLIEAFPRGTSGTATWRTLSASLVGDEEDYANRVVVNGANGVRAVAPDQQAINDDGEPITKTITDPQVKSQPAAKSLARNKLTELLKNDELTGTVNTPPTDVPPGYQYTVDVFSADLDLEQTQYTLVDDSLEGTLKFERDPLLSRQAAERQNSLQNTRESI